MTPSTTEQVIQTQIRSNAELNFRFAFCSFSIVVRIYSNILQIWWNISWQYARARTRETAIGIKLFRVIHSPVWKSGVPSLHTQRQHTLLQRKFIWPNWIPLLEQNGSMECGHLVSAWEIWYIHGTMCQAAHCCARKWHMNLQGCFNLYVFDVSAIMDVASIIFCALTSWSHYHLPLHIFDLVFVLLLLLLFLLNGPWLELQTLKKHSVSNWIASAQSWKQTEAMLSPFLPFQSGQKLIHEHSNAIHSSRSLYLSAETENWTGTNYGTSWAACDFLYDVCIISKWTKPKSVQYQPKPNPVLSLSVCALHEHQHLLLLLSLWWWVLCLNRTSTTAILLNLVSEFRGGYIIILAQASLAKLRCKRV